MADNPRIDDLRRRIASDPASIAFAQLAEEYRRAGELQACIETCRIGLARHPGYLSARITLGRALLALGQLDEAHQELTLVLKGSAENLAAIRGLAEVHHARGSLAEALTYYKMALALAQNDPDLDETVADLSQELSVCAGPLPMPRESSPPPIAPPTPVTPTVRESAGPDPATHDLPPQRTERAVYSIDVLERWLGAIAANHVTRTQPHA